MPRARGGTGGLLWPEKCGTRFSQNSGGVWERGACDSMKKIGMQDFVKFAEKRRRPFHTGFLLRHRR